MTEDEKGRPAGGGHPNNFILTEQPTAYTAEEEKALKIARVLIEGGVPVFAAPPNPDRPGEYRLPYQWEKTVPSLVNLDKWQPGWALAAVGGSVADFLDVDPRNGGEASLAEIEQAGHMPRVFGVQATPSGGTHYVISPLQERETNGFMPGLDYQGGLPNGESRAFVYIAPTVRKSKDPGTLGELRAYEWLQEPDIEYLREFEADDSIEGLRSRIYARRAAKQTRQQEYTGKPREFTRAQAEKFIQPLIDRVEAAQKGSIEEQTNALAAMLSRFVPDFWSVEVAFQIIMDALAKTVYDPNHPASTWTAEEKCLPTLRHEGNRAPSDWKATLIESATPEAPKVTGNSLRDRLLTVEKLMNMPLPAPLIKGVLDLESATWLIAQPGGFKSFVALDWSCHVATGKEWRGRKTKKAPVVYVLAEGKGNFRKRVQAWITRNGVTPDQLYVLPVAVQARGKDKTVSEEWLELVRLVKEIQPGLVVLDTQARLTVGMEENNNTEMGVWVKAVDTLKEAVNACVLVVHHTGRNGGDARGGSALDGAQDAEWRVDRKAHKLAMTLSCDKSKDGDDRTAIDFVMDVVDVGTDEDGATITSLVLGESKERNAFTEAQETDKEGLDAILARGGGIRCRDLVLGIVRSLDDGQGLTRAEIQRLGNEALKEHPSRDRVKAYAEGSYRKAIKDLTSDGRLEMSEDGTPHYSALD